MFGCSFYASANRFHIIDNPIVNGTLLMRLPTAAQEKTWTKGQILFIRKTGNYSSIPKKAGESLLNQPKTSAS
jgi:hypothetical protein